MNDSANILDQRPIQGSDLERLRRKLKLSIDEARMLFGVSMNKWVELTQGAGAREPIKNATVALLVRYYDKYPEKCPIPRAPDIDDLLELLEEGEPQKRLGPLLGKEGVSAHRWKSTNKAMSPSVKRLARHMMEEYEQGNRDEWVAMVEEEARLRGIENVFSSGSWKSDFERTYEEAERSMQNAAMDLEDLLQFQDRLEKPEYLDSVKMAQQDASAAGKRAIVAADKHNLDDLVEAAADAARAARRCRKAARTASGNKIWSEIVQMRRKREREEALRRRAEGGDEAE